jgi:hypothetical protein
VTAVVWALFGLMAASLGVLTTALFATISRIDGLRAEFNGRFDGLREDMREVRAAVAGVDRRLTAAGG